MSEYRWQRGQPGIGRAYVNIDHQSGSPNLGRLTPVQLKSRLERAGKDFILLDIRTAQEWQYDGRIRGARWIPMDELLVKAEAELPRDAEIVVCCAHGVRSAAVARYLARAGYTHVSDLAGGLLAWEAAGFPLSAKY